MVTAAHIAERLGTPRRNPVVVGRSDARQARDAPDARCRGRSPARLRRDRCRCEPAVRSRSAIRAVGLPCVVKPVDLAASRGVIRADTMAEADCRGAAHRHAAAPDLRARHDPTAAGRSATSTVSRSPSRVCSMTACSRSSRLFDKPDPLRGPFFEETLYVTPSRLDRAMQDAVVDEVRAAIAALGTAPRPDPRGGADRGESRRSSSRSPHDPSAVCARR